MPVKLLRPVCTSWEKHTVQPAASVGANTWLVQPSCVVHVNAICCGELAHIWTDGEHRTDTCAAQMQAVFPKNPVLTKGAQVDLSMVAREHVTHYLFKDELLPRVACCDEDNDSAFEHMSPEPASFQGSAANFVLCGPQTQNADYASKELAGMGALSSTLKK